MGLFDLFSGGTRLRKPNRVRHQGKTLSEILEAHKNHFLGHAGGKRAEIYIVPAGATFNVEGTQTFKEFPPQLDVPRAPARRPAARRPAAPTTPQ